MPNGLEYQCGSDMAETRTRMWRPFDSKTGNGENMVTKALSKPLEGRKVFDAGLRPAAQATPGKHSSICGGNSMTLCDPRN